jgi:hypothetical protein
MGRLVINIEQKYTLAASQQGFSSMELVSQQLGITGVTCAFEAVLTGYQSNIKVFSFTSFLISSRDGATTGWFWIDDRIYWTL